MIEERETSIRASAREIAIREHRQSPKIADALPEDILESFVARELENAATYVEMPWLEQDLCARIYVYVLLRTIGQKELEKIGTDFQYPSPSSGKSLNYVLDISFIPVSQTQVQLDNQLDNVLLYQDSLQPSAGSDLNEATQNMHYPSDSLLPSLTSPTGDILKALDYIPVAWQHKKLLLEALYRRYSESLGLVKSRLETIGLKARRDLLTFSRLDRQNVEEIHWATEYFNKYILSIYKGRQVSVVYSYSETIRNTSNIDLKYYSLQAMLLLWRANITDRMLFDTQFSRALSQRRHKAKHKDRVPLNTRISPKSKSQLKTLAIRKQKTQYEVLEELIYQAYKSKGSTAGSE